MTHKRLLSILRRVIKSADSLVDAERMMRDSGLVTCGVEEVECGDEWLRYVNRGDTYNDTICTDANGLLFISSWGSWYEQTESTQNRRDNTVTCGYCSKRTPTYGVEWSEVVCDHCHNLVGG